MAFPETGVLETFTGVNGTSPPNANWTNDLLGLGGGGAIEIQTNQGAGAGGEEDSAWWNATTFGPDCEVYVTVPTRPAGDGGDLHIGLRIENPGNPVTMTGYFLEIVRDDLGGDYLQINRGDPGYSTVPLGAAIVFDFQDGDSLGLEAIGDTFKAYHKVGAGDWVEVAERTDNTYGNAGVLGLILMELLARVDDFGGGLMGAGFGIPHLGSMMRKGA